MREIKAIVGIVLISAFALVASAMAQQNNVISIGDFQAVPGKSITTPILINNSVNISGIKINLSYNPAVVNVTNASLGDFDASPHRFDLSNASNGYVRIYVVKYLGLSGNKTVVNVELTAVSSAHDTSDLSISIIALKNDTGLEVTDRSTKNGTFTILTATPFDTGHGTYPSIFGIHKGTIKPNQTITVYKMYTYPCPGTGGHSEYVRIYNESGTIAEGNWTGYGYGCDWHTISFDTPFILKANETYNYSIRTGSYPQIIHKHRANVTGGGIITCEEFIDANGKIYYDWIPAIKFFW